MTTASNPNITITTNAATGTISNEPQRLLFVGQILSTATATSGVLVENIGNSGEEDALFGAKSMLAQMVRQAKTVNQTTQFDAIPLDDASGTAATGTVVIAGTATAAGNLTLKIGSGENYSMVIPVAVDDTETDVGDAIDAAVLLMTNAPFTSNNAAGTVTFTSSHEGTVGNHIAYKVEGAVAGITVALTVPVNGATDPTLTNLFDVIDGQRYQGIVYPEGYVLTTLTTELTTRLTTANAILDGQGFQAMTDTFGNIQTAANAQNNRNLCIGGVKLLTDTTHKGGAIVEFGDVLSAKTAAIRALRNTDGADVSQFVIGGSQFGGIHQNSRPYFNTPIPNVDLIPVGKGFSATEVEQLKTAGAYVWSNNTGRTSIILDEVVTTRKTNAASVAETTFKYLNAVDQTAAVREFYFNNGKAQFPQSILTDGDLPPNAAGANQAVLEAWFDNVYNTLSGQDYLLVKSGKTAMDDFKAARTVTITTSTGTVDAVITIQLIGQLRTMTIQINVSF